MIKVNNVIAERRVVVVATHLRDAAADWYKTDKTNINQYHDENNISFIRQIKAQFTLDEQKDQWYTKLHQLRRASEQLVNDYINKFQKLQ